MSHSLRLMGLVVFLGSGLGLFLSPVGAHDGDAASDSLSAADRYVRQAIQFRMEGDHKYSDMLLRLALRASPEHLPAHWASGEILLGGEWLKVPEADSHFADSSALKEYQDLRDQLGGAPDADLRLARLCRKLGWEDSVRIHLVRHIRNPNATDASRVTAMRQLGYQEFEGELVAPSEIRQLKQSRNRDQKAERKWYATVERWATQLESEKSAVRDHALEQLLGVNDPLAISALEAVLAMQDSEWAVVTVEVIGQLEAPQSTRSLARIALQSPDAVAAQRATELLRDRPMHEYVPLLLGALSGKLESRFRVVAGDSGAVYHEHFVREEGSDASQMAVRRNLALPLVAAGGGIVQGRQPVTGREARMERAENELYRQMRCQQELNRLSQEALDIERHVSETNKTREQANAQIFTLLRVLTEADVPESAQDWWNWWTGYNDVYVYDRPTYTNCFDSWYGYSVPVAQTTKPLPRMPSPKSAPRARSRGQQQLRRWIAMGIRPSRLLFNRPSCFVAGTPVWTTEGKQAIDSIQPGDRVLSQDVDTGEWSFRVVAQTTLRPPTEVVRIQVEGSHIDATPGHPFWVVGVGWRMAKLLKEGDVVYTIDGDLPIVSIENVAAEPVYNLVVDTTHNYFVGDSGVLVHDNNYRSPTRSVTPGLQPEPIRLAAD